MGKFRKSKERKACALLTLMKIQAHGSKLCSIKFTSYYHKTNLAKVRNCGATDIPTTPEIYSLKYILPSFTFFALQYLMY